MQTCNNYAKTCLSKGKIKAAVHILKTCLDTLTRGYVFNIASQKFLIVNSIAQAYNFLGNVKLSLRYLIESVTCASVAESLDTFINISNAHKFLEQYQEAIHFANRAILAGRANLDEIVARMETAQNKEAIDMQYQSCVSIYSLSY